MGLYLYVTFYINVYFYPLLLPQDNYLVRILEGLKVMLTSGLAGKSDF